MLDSIAKALKEGGRKIVGKQPQAAGRTPATEEFLELGRGRAWGQDGHGRNWVVIRALAGISVSRESGLLLGATDITEVRGPVTSVLV